jgi:hypothetical protein
MKRQKMWSQIYFSFKEFQNQLHTVCNLWEVLRGISMLEKGKSSKSFIKSQGQKQYQRHFKIVLAPL